MAILKGELHRLRIFSRPFVVRRYFKENAEPKLNLGCGSKVVPGWLNVDKFAPTADAYMNACARFSFPADVFKAVYVEHLLEHIKVDKVPFLLSELYRVIQPDGILRIICPDLELHAAMYHENRSEFFKPFLKRFEEYRKTEPRKYWLVRTKGGVFNTRFVERFYHHRWMYDFETLDICLREIGFQEVVRQAHRKSLLDDMGILDSEEGKEESLYVDAVK